MKGKSSVEVHKKLPNLFLEYVGRICDVESIIYRNRFGITNGEHRLIVKKASERERVKILLPGTSFRNPKVMEIPKRERESRAATSEKLKDHSIKLDYILNLNWALQQHHEDDDWIKCDFIESEKRCWKLPLGHPNLFVAGSKQSSWGISVPLGRSSLSNGWKGFLSVMFLKVLFSSFT